MENKKYFITTTKKIIEGKTLYQVQRIKDGRLGGFIESENNLSQKGTCFLDSSSYILGDSFLGGDVLLISTSISRGNIKGRGCLSYCKIDISSSLVLNTNISKTSLLGNTLIKNSPIIKGSTIIDSTIDKNTEIYNSNISNCKIHDETVIENSTISDTSTFGKPSIFNSTVKESLIKDSVIIRCDDGSVITDTTIKEEAQLYGKLDISDCWIIGKSIINGTDRGLKLQNKCKVSRNSNINGHGIVDNSVITDEAFIAGEIHIINECKVSKRGALISTPIKDGVHVRSGKLYNIEGFYGKITI